MPGVVCAQQKQLHIAAAADLQPVLPALAAEYERTTGVKVSTTFGSSATLTEQIRNGAPQDLFLSADFAHPELLVAEGLTDSAAPVPYAHGVLVLWARKDSPAQPLSLDTLGTPAVTKIAVANPDHAPYGLAAKQAMHALGLAEKLGPKLVVAENIVQTAQFVESGNAQAGFLSLTTASTQHFRDAGTFVLVPAKSYKCIEQTGVVLKAAKNVEAARAFLAWLTSDAVQARLKGFGLEAVK